MSTTISARPQPIAPPRAVRRFRRWFMLALAAVVVTGVAVLAFSLPDPVATDTAGPTFEADTATSRLTAIGYLTEEGVHERETTQYLQRRGLVPTGPSQTGDRSTTEDAETRRLVGRGLVPAGS